MSKPGVHLADDQMAIVPGLPSSTELTIRNNSPRVGEYRIFVPPASRAANWVMVRLADEGPEAGRPERQVSLHVGQETRVVLTFNAPVARSTPAGHVDYTLAIEALDDGHESAVLVASVDVAPIVATRTQVTPASTSSRMRSRHRLSILNEGTVPATYRMLAKDFESEDLSVAWTPREVLVAPGSQGDFLIEVRPRRIHSFGQDRQYRATFATIPVIRGIPQPAENPHDVQFEHKAWVPAWLLPPLLVLLAVPAYLWWSRQPASEAADPPNPPTDLGAIINDDTALLGWSPDVRATATEVRIIDCAHSESSDAPALVTSIFENVAIGELELPNGEGDQLCFQARTLDSSGISSVWSQTQTARRPDSDLPTPQNLRVEGDRIVWDAVEGDDVNYELVVDNTPTGVLLIGTWTPLLDASPRPGQRSVQVRSVGKGSESAVGSRLTIEIPEDQTGPSQEEDNKDSGAGIVIQQPWVLLKFSQQPFAPAELDEVKVLLINLGPQLAAIDLDAAQGHSIEQVQLADNHPGSGPEGLAASSGNNLLTLVGRFAIVDRSPNLTNDLAQRYCAIVNRWLSTADAIPVTCFAFDSNGHQLEAAPATTSSTTIPGHTTTTLIPPTGPPISETATGG